MVMVDMRVGHEGESAIVEAPSADAEPLAGSLAKGSVLFRAEDGLVSSRLLVAAESSRLQVIDTFNRRLDEVEFGEWRTISYEVKDPSGKLAPQVLESCVLLPPDRDDRPLPLIVEVYPDVGPSCNNGAPKITFANPVSEYLWAGRGYAYTRLTMPRELIRTAQGPIAGMDELVDSGVEALAREGLIDPDRVALFGLSQGGISALYTAAHSDRFKAVIAINSWADLFSQYFGPNGIYSYAYGQDFGDFARYDSIVGSDFGIGRTPFDDPEVYYRNSPVFLAPQIEAPVMLIHSDMDSFSMSQFDEMYGALTRAGKDARYVRYWGEGHVPSSPANIRDMWQRIDDFLGEHGVAP
jgi:dipeptidyl aminopeptidase/acylaminoacyl peptidase